MPPKIKVLAGLGPSRRLWGKSVPCPSQLLGGTCSPWFLAASSIFRASTVGGVLLTMTCTHPVSFPSTSQAPVTTLAQPETQHLFPVSRPLMSSLNRICHLNPPLPCNLRQARGIRVRASLGASLSARVLSGTCESRKPTPSCEAPTYKIPTPSHRWEES